MSESAEQLRQEISFLKQQLEVVADGVTEQKYLQQAKKLRELSVKLDSEKARVAKLQQTIIKNEREQSERSEAERKGVLLPSNGSGSSNNGKAASASAAELEIQHLSTQLSDARSKLERASALNASLRAQLEKHDKETNKVRKILVAEIGDEATVDKLLNLENNNNNNTENNNNNNNNDDTSTTITTAATAVAGYRGRAQQISLLQTKVKDLTRKVNEHNSVAAMSDIGSMAGGIAPSVITHVTAAGVSTTIKDYDATHRSVIAQQESKKSVEIRQLQQAVEESKEAATKEKQRGDALTSRVHVLEKQLQHLRSSLQQVVAKTENDNNLIDAYKQEIENQRSEIRQMQLLGNTNNPTRLQAGSNSVAFSSPRQMAAALLQQQSNNNNNNSHNSNSTNSAELSRIQQLEKEVSTLQKQLVSVPTTSSSKSKNDNNDNSVGGNSNNSSDKNLDSAVGIVESQRKMILSLEQRLQSVESQNRNKSSNFTNDNENRNVTQALRDENASLKERMSALTLMVEREVELKKAQLEAKYNNNNSSNNAVQRGSAIISTTTSNAISSTSSAQVQSKNNTPATNPNVKATSASSSSTTEPKIAPSSTSAAAPTRSTRPTMNSNNNTNNNFVAPPPPSPPAEKHQNHHRNQFQNHDDDDDDYDEEPHGDDEGDYDDNGNDQEIASISTRSVPARNNVNSASTSVKPLSLRGL